MPKIRIVDKDLTTGNPELGILDTVVYVPGPCTTDFGAVEPTLCTTVDELLKLTEAVPGQAIVEDDCLSFVLAKYLISTFNFYVLYEGIPKKKTTSEGTEVITKVPASSWSRLQDTNNYDITFLTTGQYEGVDSSAAGCAAARGDCVYLANTEKDVTAKGDPEYTLLTSETRPTEWPESDPQDHKFPATNFPYFEEAPMYLPVIKEEGAEAPEFEPGVYYLKVNVGTTPNYVVLAVKPTNWEEMVTTSTETTQIFIINTVKYNALAGTTWKAYEANKYYKETQETLDWVFAVRNKFTSGLTSGQTYCAGFAPWFVTQNANLLVGTGSTYEVIPAAFGALFAYGRMAQDAYPWFAAAGPNYGFINEAVKFNHKCSNAECEILQARAATGEVDLDGAGDNIGMAINPMTEVKPFGNILWGYRTARNNGTDGLKATSFLNVRILVNILKKYLRQIARKYTFAQNDGLLWTNFSADVTKVLEMLKVGRGISDYSIKQVPTTAKARLKAKITIVPIEPVEDFDLEIDLTDSLEVTE